MYNYNIQYQPTPAWVVRSCMKYLATILKPDLYPNPDCGLKMKYSTWLHLVLYMSLTHSLCAIYFHVASTCGSALIYTYM